MLWYWLEQYLTLQALPKKRVFAFVPHLNRFTTFLHKTFSLSSCVFDIRVVYLSKIICFLNLFVAKMGIKLNKL